MNEIFLAAVLSFILLIFWLLKKPAPPSPFPPGPKPIPLLGNLRDLTANELWLQAHKWGKQFGDVTYVHVFGQGIVFFNTVQAASDAMDKGGSIYSDKPKFVMVGELCGCDRMVAFTPYGDRSRAQRKLMMRALGVQTIRTYRPLIEAGTHDFLRRLVVDPADFMKHITRYAGSLTLSVVYGHQVKSDDDKYLEMSNKCVTLLAELSSGGGLWPVDIFPFLKKLPMWMPGAGFQRTAINVKAQIEQCVEDPFQYTKSSIKAGTAVPSFVSTLLEKDGSAINAEEENDIKWIANTIFVSSIDTSLSVLSQFILAMVHFPAVMKRAQKELDEVVGPNRLPTFADRESLPYIEGVMSEVLRWGAPVPMSLPHRLMEDDIYCGKFIPKGTLIFANVWSMSRCETVYPDPESFIPERFMEKLDDEIAERQRDPRTYVFGFGRRRCPGTNLVESSIWLMIACMLSVLDISKVVDESGNVVEPKVQYENPIFRIPTNFECNIQPRPGRLRNLQSDA